MLKKSQTKFVNSLYLTNFIQSQFGESLVKIKKYEVEAPSGDSTIASRSFIRRVLVKYSSKENAEKVISLVIKIRPEYDEHRNLDIFKKELDMYKNLLPKIEKSTVKFGSRIEFAPRYEIRELIIFRVKIH
jgi:hypothetical protein